MRYLYENVETGEHVEVEGLITSPPGFVIERGGKTLRRVISVQRSKKERQKLARDPKGNRIGNKSLPRGWPFAQKHDAMGRPVFDTAGEREEAHARARAAGEFAGPRELSQPGDLPHTMRADE